MLSQQILAYSLRYKGDWTLIAKAIGRNESWSEKKSLYPYCTINDERYPVEFRSLRYPPWLFFYQGNLELLKREKIAVIGSRKLSAYGERCERQLCLKLKQKYAIVSGLAMGADGVAHQVCFEQGKTIGIIGNGLDIIYPKINEVHYQTMRKDHLILSEYPQGVAPSKEHFPWRNRLIASLSKAIVVVQAQYHSGTMLTVNEAIALNKPIYCVPYPMDDVDGSGCNLLICQGAQILTKIEDWQII